MPDDMSDWLMKLGLSKYVSNFADNDIVTRLLAQLLNDELKISLRQSDYLSTWR